MILDAPDFEPPGDPADLRTLAQGFLDLSRTAGHAVLPEVSSAPSLPAAPLKPQPAFAVGGEPGVTPPVPIRQDVPKWVTQFAQQRGEGLLALMIAEDGRVESVTIVDSIHTLYDAAVLNAAKTWRYQPAMKAGKPIRFQMTAKIIVGR